MKFTQTCDKTADKAAAPGSRRRPYVILAALTAMVAVLAFPLRRLPAAPNDFAIYWAAGRKVLAGGNPYAPEHVLVQQRIRFGGADPPVAVVLAIGQIGPLLLLGVAGFLRFESKQKYAWGGAFMYLLSLKPHLALLLWAALFLYVVLHWQWKMAFGFLAAVAAMSAVAVAVHPAVFREYSQLWRGSSGFVSELNPTLGGLLVIASHTYWAQFIQVVLSGIWLVVYWRWHAHA